MSLECSSTGFCAVISLPVSGALPLPSPRPETHKYWMSYALFEWNQKRRFEGSCLTFGSEGREHDLTARTPPGLWLLAHGLDCLGRRRLLLGQEEEAEPILARV